MMWHVTKQSLYDDGIIVIIVQHIFSLVILKIIVCGEFTHI